MPHRKNGHTASRMPQVADSAGGGPVPLEATAPAPRTAAVSRRRKGSFLQNNLAGSLGWSFVTGLLISGWLMSRSRDNE
jgi:hypothetical protein